MKIKWIPASWLLLVWPWIFTFSHSPKNPRLLHPLTTSVRLWKWNCKTQRKQHSPSSSRRNRLRLKRWASVGWVDAIRSVKFEFGIIRSPQVEKNEFAQCKASTSTSSQFQGTNDETCCRKKNNWRALAQQENKSRNSSNIFVLYVKVTVHRLHPLQFSLSLSAMLHDLEFLLLTLPCFVVTCGCDAGCSRVLSRATHSLIDFLL